MPLHAIWTSVLIHEFPKKNMTIAVYCCRCCFCCCLWCWYHVGRVLSDREVYISISIHGVVSSFIHLYSSLHMLLCRCRRHCTTTPPSYDSAWLYTFKMSANKSKIKRRKFEQNRTEQTTEMEWNETWKKRSERERKTKQWRREKNGDREQKEITATNKQTRTATTTTTTTKRRK